MSRTLWRAVSLIAVVCTACAGKPPDVAWSPRSADLLITSNHEGNGEIYLLPGGGTEWVNLTNHEASDNWPVWSPDGKRIVFQSRRTGNLDIWVMNADGSDPVQLTHDPQHDYLPSWTPDGNEISFTSWRTEPGEDDAANHVYLMNADGTNQRRLVDESPGTSAGASWSPDGSRFALDRRVGETGADIFLFDRAGQMIERLTEDEPYSGDPSFSPDGSRVAFYSDSGDTSRIEVLQLDGSSRTVLPTEGQCWYPRWSPDGRWIVYTARLPGSEERDLDVLAIPLDGSSAPITLAGAEGAQTEGRWRPR